MKGSFKLKRYFKLIIKVIGRKISFFGFNYKCNICGSTVRKMLPGGHKHEIFKTNLIVVAGYR